MRYILLAITLLAALSRPAEASFTARTSGDFQVNAYTTFSQHNPDIAPLPSGDFVVVWGSYIPGNGKIVARRVGADGVPLGSESQINVNVTVSAPFVSSDASGNYVVVWNRDEIVGRRFDSAGNALGGEFVINVYATGYQFVSDVAHLAAGDFIVVWNDITGGDRVKARHFDTSGAPVGGDIEIGDPGGWGASAAAAADGSFLMTWRGSSGGGDAVLVRAYSSPEAPLGAGPSVVAEGGSYPSAAALSTGDYLVTWAQSVPLSGYDVLARRVDATGQPVGTEFPVNEYTTGTQMQHRVAPLPGGGAVVVFTSDDATWRDVYMRSFDASLVAAEGDILVSQRLRGAQTNPVVGIKDSGSFVVAWTDDYYGQYELGRDGDRHGVFGRLVCDDADTACDVCPGFDDAIDNDADGVPDGCDRCTNTAGAQDITVKPRMTVRARIAPEIAAKANQIRMRGEVSLPGGFGAIDPISDGLQLRVESAHDGVIIDATVPPGLSPGVGAPGWKTNAAGTVARYKDQSGAIEGISQLVVKDASSKAPGHVQFSLRAAGGIYALGPRYAPVRGIVVFGDAAASDAGLCGETAFEITDCKVVSELGESASVSCRQ